MAITINGIVCQELVANYGESAQLTGISSRKGYLCDWGDRFTVARGLLGLTSTTSVGGSITLVAPSPHPQLLNCYCIGVDMQPAGRPTQGTPQIQWDKCVVWANYGSLNFTWGPGQDPFMQIDPATPFQYATQELNVGTEVVTVPGRKLKFSGGQPLDIDWGIKIALVDINITLHRVPYLPGQAIIAKAGSINNATYLGVAAGSLIFNGAQNRMMVLSDGSYTQEITYSFTARQYPWDYAYNTTAGAWQKVTLSGGGDVITRVSFVGIFPDEYTT